MLTTADIVRRHAAERPDHPALRWSGGQWTYAELDARSSRAAQLLHGLGAGAGDRVAFLDLNGPEQIEMFFGAAKINAVLASVNWRLTPVELAYVLGDTGATVLFAGEPFAEIAREVAAQIGRDIEVIILGEEYEGRLASQPAEDPRVPQAPHDVTYQLYSSGTTGLPKGVELTNANALTSFSIYDREMGMGPDSISLVALPMFHVGGGGWALAAHIQGATNFIVREPDPAALIEVFVDEGITHTVLIPVLMQLMLAVPGVEDADFGAWKSCMYGAAPISETVLTQAIETFGCDFLQVYGLTETTGTISVLPPSDHVPGGPNAHRLRAAGKAVPPNEMKVVDPSTRAEVPLGSVGEIWIKGPNVMKGYWKAPEQTAEAIVDGWFRSGDAGYMDADGYVYLQDRVKDMIISGGENIYPAEVENVLAAHPAVADCAVIAVPSEQWGETPKALIVRKPGIAVTAEEIVAHCRESLAGYKAPSSVDWIDELPRNPSGKILKKDLRAPFWEGRERQIG